MTSAGANAIYYTIDGSTPTTASTLYARAVSISNNTVLQAVGANSGSTGPIASAIFTILPPPPVYPEGGTYANLGTLSVTISDAANASIYYTTDGTAPTNASTPYTGVVSLPVGTTTLKAIAIDSNGSSTITSREYILPLPPPVFPVFSLTSGTYQGVQSVTINSTNATSIYYTTDGTVPTTSSTLYNGPISISWGQRDIAGNRCKQHCFRFSATIATYTIIPIPSAPVFSPAAGTYSNSVSISISSLGATSIYYTTNNSKPSNASHCTLAQLPYSPVLRYRPSV